MRTASAIQERLASEEVVEWVKRRLGKNKEKGPLVLTRCLCEALGLRDPRGQWRLAGVQKALRVLEARGCRQLPKLQGKKLGRRQPRRLDHQ